MFIHHIKEGDKHHIGLNWKSNERTFLSLTLVIPIYLIIPKKYCGFDTENIYYGWQVRLVYFCIRIRRWKYFPSNVKKVLWHINSYVNPFGRQQFIATREMLEDGKCQ